SLCCVTVNHILLMMLVLIVCLLLYSKLFRGPKDPERAPKVLVEKAMEGEDDIPVVICAAEERMGGAMATINSIYSNTDASVFFIIVTLCDSIKLTRQYIEKTTLKGIKCKLLEFNPHDLLHPLNFVRFYLPLLDISHKRYLHSVTTSDIKDLYHTKLEKGHAAAFATDCDLPSTHEMVRSRGMQGSTTYMGFLEWKKQKITKQENIYSSAMAGGVATPPMLTVFHDKYAIIDPLWHVRHLGWSPDARNSETFLQGAHLLHWNSRFKSWDYPYPTGKFLLVLPEGKI
uniref:Glycosyltransferase 8 domain containing 2 n=1 Tax=Oncorhynchus kisutch TaxID=8019 RepID=A0A8C7HHR2_ONCKI